MGRVDLAMRQIGRFRRFYAIKHLHPHLANEAAPRAMFLEEARIGGMLVHPNVVGVIDVGEDAQGPFLVMDFVEGLSLGALQQAAIDHGEPLPLGFCLDVAIAIAKGLDGIHTAVDAQGKPLALVHRDLSPRNVLIGYDGSIRITDFGIAKANDREIRTTTGVLKGTVGYLAPERLRFEEPDPRSDLFSLGVILYELLGSERLYPGGGAEAARCILSEPAPDIGELRPDCPAELTGLLFQLLAKDRTDRPSSAGAVISILESVLAKYDPRTDIGGDTSAPVASLVKGLSADRRAAQRAWIEKALARVEKSGARRADAPKPDSPASPSLPSAGWLRPRWPRYLLIAAAAIGVLSAVGFGTSLAMRPERSDAMKVTSPPSPERLLAPMESEAAAPRAATSAATNRTDADRRRARARRRMLRRQRIRQAAKQRNAEVRSKRGPTSTDRPLEMSWTGEFE